MASDTNQVTIIGRLTRDPEMRALASGTSLCEIGVAVNSTQKNRDTQEWEDSPNFFNVTCWGKQGGGGLAETVAKFCSKGDRVCVTGRLQQQTWTEDNGGKRERVSIVANSVQFLTTKTERDERGGQAPAATQAPADEEIPF
jgi:single-strand DNA-binding protein